MALLTSLGEDIAPIGVGPRAQYSVPLSFVAPLTIPAGGVVTSDFIPSGGMTGIAVGATSTQAGMISVQRFLDMAATIPIGAPATASLSAGTANGLTITDGVIFLSFTVSLSNSSSAAASLTGLAVVQQA